jgi:hypothetical protein
LPLARMAGDKPMHAVQAHPAGLCDVAYLQIDGGAIHMVTCGQDGRLCYRHAVISHDVPSAVAPD